MVKKLTTWNSSRKNLTCPSQGKEFWGTHTNVQFKQWNPHPNQILCPWPWDYHEQQCQLHRPHQWKDHSSEVKNWLDSQDIPDQRSLAYAYSVETTCVMWPRLLLTTVESWSSGWHTVTGIITTFDELHLASKDLSYSTAYPSTWGIKPEFLLTSSR